MDGSDFDTLVQSLGSAGSRRRALGGLLLGSVGFLGWGRAEDAAAHDALPACKKKSGKQKKKCLKKAKKHNAAHQAATCATPCVVPACQTCRNGSCVPANEGQVCAMSAMTLEPVRCCSGACPDPACTPSGYIGQSCNGPADCTNLNCCSGKPASCPPIPGETGECFCTPAQPGEPCGSDLDCDNNLTATACICNKCQEPL